MKPDGMQLYSNEGCHKDQVSDAQRTLVQHHHGIQD